MLFELWSSTVLQLLSCLQCRNRISVCPWPSLRMTEKKWREDWMTKAPYITCQIKCNFNRGVRLNYLVINSLSQMLSTKLYFSWTHKRVTRHPGFSGKVTIMWEYGERICLQKCASSKQCTNTMQKGPTNIIWVPEQLCRQYFHQQRERRAVCWTTMERYYHQLSKHCYQFQGSHTLQVKCKSYCLCV